MTMSHGLHKPIAGINGSAKLLDIIELVIAPHP